MATQVEPGTRPTPDAPQSTDGLFSPDLGTVTVWSDIGCPWATLALHTLHAAARRRGEQLLVDHRVFPLELFNRQSTPKPIIDAEIVAIGAKAPELGWRLWSSPEWSYPVTTLPAMEAVQAAKAPAVGGLAASDELDTALRRAFYAQGRCISVPSEILDVAAECESVDEAALAEALERGAGRAEIYRDFAVASGPRVQGSPHMFTAAGVDVHNPGATYRWTGDPYDGGFPDFTAYSEAWAEELLDSLQQKPS
ncbi:DsbA family oxidoreductase [Kitasatospora atroaurantiaca]|uniref:Putative DsbA family dithiol-disulfide isomerase n=1 Tax=Kitasatospora atroaurantiaca TaxID=285545 RepID=A0A561EU73_9ACTN|nr:DsbA family protein [Kitasatospora atroaurantiaca]TWE19121.1 putative DsbA family dithiol-disulfide isomerase [Kitasatospora atroaurantiaca]